jgi:hypothetical protein
MRLARRYYAHDNNHVNYLEALQIKLPEVLPGRKIRVVTRKNLLFAVKTNKYKAFTVLLFFALG